MPTAQIENLAVFSHSRQLLDYWDEKFRVIGHIVHLALGLLESKNGHHCLQVIGQAIFEALQRINISISNGFNPEALSNHIDFFLAAIRRSFPPIQIDDGLTDIEAMMIPDYWGYYSIIRSLLALYF